MTKSDYYKCVGIIISGTVKSQESSVYLYVWDVNRGTSLTYFSSPGSKTLTASIFFNFYQDDNMRGLLNYGGNVTVIRYISGQGILLRLERTGGGIVTITNTKIYALLLN